MIPSLSSMTLVRDQVRMSALASFEYTANTVLAYGLDEELCSYLQDIIIDEEDHFVHTKRPRTVAIALQVWLEAKGVSVLSDVEVPKHEIVEWLDLKSVETFSAVALEIRKDGVQVSWL